MDIDIKAITSYRGHSLQENGNVNVTFLFKYDELINTIQLTQLLNNDVTVSVKVSGKVLKLGMFRIKNISIDGDGESKVKLNSMNDFVEVDNLNNIVTKDLFPIRFIADVEKEEDDES